MDSSLLNDNEWPSIDKKLIYQSIQFMQFFHNSKLLN
jgi:hypothetical protein